MSSYSTLQIENFEIDNWKYDIDPAVMMLFTRTDKRVSPISLDQWLADGGEEEYWSGDLSLKPECRRRACVGIANRCA
jgi:hypothetical protein